MSSSPLLRQIVPVGNVVVTSGQIGTVDGVLVDGGITAQTAQALSNLAAVLATADLAICDVVKVNVYLTTMAHYDAMNVEYARTFFEMPPARTAVAVHELPFGALVEVEAWARPPR